MRAINRTDVYPVEGAAGLDNGLRRWFQDPEEILKPFIRPGSTVIDLGCGPGFFTIDAARLAGNSGKVYAVDLQQGMLDMLITKIENNAIRNIRPHLCTADTLGLDERADFIYAFNTIHEIKDKPKIFRELRKLLKPGGKLLITEPKFHVKKRDFELTVTLLVGSDFVVLDEFSTLMSRSVVLLPA